MGNGHTRTKAECWDEFWQVIARGHAEACRRRTAERTAETQQPPSE